MIKRIEVLIQNIKNGDVYNISEIVSSLEWQTYIDFSSGTFEFEMLKDEKVKVNEGDIVSFKFDDIKIFFGKVFKKSKSHKVMGWKISCFDSLIYFKNKETLVIGPLSSSELFTKICKENNFSYKVINESHWKAPSIVHDDKSIYDILQDNLDKTLINSGAWFIIRDNFGTLEHVSLNSLITTLVIGDESLLTEYEYTSSIEDSYNEVKLFQDNKETNKREVYIVKDSKNIDEWGKLLFTEKMDEKLNPAQIKLRANYIHQSLNKPKRTLNLPCLGVPYIRAGNSIVLSLKELISEGFEEQQLSIIRKASHKWEDSYTMDLEVVVV